jgi:mannose-6-phosphate isomerase-like protein (cupin superfamily)
VFEVGAGEVVVIPPGGRHNLSVGPNGVRYLCVHAPGISRPDDFVPVADRVNE